jgi:hypothetical protein
MDGQLLASDALSGARRGDQHSGQHNGLAGGGRHSPPAVVGSTPSTDRAIWPIAG